EVVSATATPSTGTTSPQSTAFIVNTITTGSISGPLCSASQLSVPYTVTGTYTSNTFTAQLSDALGTFITPVNIGTLVSNTSGTISATIPAGTSGTAFRIRVISSNPSITGTDNGTNLIINPEISYNSISSDHTICAGNTPNTITGTSPYGGSGSYSYWWEESSNGTTWNTLTGASGMNYASPAISATTHYRRIVNSGSCSDISNIVIITVNPLPNVSANQSHGTLSISIPSGGSAANWVPWTYTFMDPLPTGATITGVELTYTSRDQGWGGTGDPANLYVGGNYIGSNILYGNSQTFTLFTMAPFPSYNYGANNTVELHFTGFPGWEAFWEGGTLIIHYSKPSICSSTPIKLYGGGALTYTWNNGISNGATIIPSATTTYTVIGTNANGCSDTASTTVTVATVPIVTANSTASEICLGASLTLTGSGANTYVWNNGVINGTAFSPTATNTYTLMGTNTNGCSASDTITIIVNQLSNVIFPNLDSVCSTDNAIQLTAGTPSGGIYSGPGVSGNEFDPSIGTGTYALTYTYTDSNNCTNSANSSIAVNTTPEGFVINSNSPVCEGYRLLLSATEIPGAIYKWTGPSGFTSDSVSTTVENFNNNKEGNYYLNISLNGCPGNFSLYADLKNDCNLKIYNSITPNNDNVNDTWIIDGISSYPENQVLIFNRWGDKVWETTNYNNEDKIWKGTNLDGNPLPIGTYFYIVKFEDETLKNYVELMK
ncbi:MAG: gliding motility-associated C-terminal domain-containing protein, partial [Bacteroidota bacterium]|nr:gliding motility-associated C-terminal domain-containing protein [Bacteroidota bacterium]